MLVVTVAAGDEVAGCLVGFATQASIDPPRYVVYLSEKNRTYRLARDSEHLAVHFLAPDDQGLAERFGGRTGDEVDKFADVAWTPGPGGTPLLDRCSNRFVGRVLERRAQGDHVAFLLEPVAAERGMPVRQLDFHRARAIDSGHEA